MDSTGSQKKTNTVLIILIAVFGAIFLISSTVLVTVFVISPKMKTEETESATIAEEELAESSTEEETTTKKSNGSASVPASSVNPVNAKQETTTASSAGKAGNYRVSTSEGLYIRSGASKSSSTIGDLDVDDIVYVSKFSNGFAYIPLYNGWVLSQYLSATSSPVNVTGYSPDNYMVISSSVSVRTGPGTQYSTVKTIKSGTVFGVSSVSRNWGYSSDLGGYVKLIYCASTGAEVNINSSDKTTCYYYYEDCGDICIKDSGGEEYYIGYAKNNLSAYTSYYIKHQSGCCGLPQCTKYPKGAYEDGRGPDEETEAWDYDYGYDSDDYYDYDDYDDDYYNDFDDYDEHYY